MLASLSNCAFIQRFNEARLSIRRLFFRAPKRAGKVHDQRICGRSERRQANAPPRDSLTIILASFVLFAWLPATRAQSFDFPSSNHSQNHTVSVRELRIPAKARVAFDRGVQSMHKGDAAEGLRHFNRAIQEFSEYYEAYYNKGVALMELDKDDAALQSFQTAIDLSRGHFARAYVGYALILNRQRRSKDAETVVRRGLQEDHTIADGYAVLSAALFDEGLLDEAEESAQKALCLPNPSARIALLTLAFVHIKKQEYPLAVQDLESYLKAVHSGQVRDDAGFVKYIESKLSDAKAKASLNLQARTEQ